MSLDANSRMDFEIDRDVPIEEEKERHLPPENLYDYLLIALLVMDTVMVRNLLERVF